MDGTLPINNRAKALLARNQEKSKRFVERYADRQLYRSQHPTNIMAFKCMDGRLNLSVMTKTEPGIIQPFRNIGGQFDFSWPFFQHIVLDEVEDAIHNGNPTLILVTYHFSKGCPNRGCAGFGYDTKQAIANSEKIIRQLKRIFGEECSVVYPVMLGIETDEDTFVLHGEKPGAILDLADFLSGTSEQDLAAILRGLYPRMSSRVFQDFLPLIVGNLQHRQEVLSTPRPPHDIEHKETVLAIGRGFSWLHQLNTALIVGPFSTGMDTSIVKAAGIIMSNVQEGRVVQDGGLVLMVSSVCKEDQHTPRWRAAEEKSYGLANNALRLIKEHVPDLHPLLHPLVGVLDVDTQYFHRIRFDPDKIR